MPRPHQEIPLLRTFLQRLAAIPSQVLLALIWAYRRLLSPLLPASCRYHPSCSVYALGSIATHGVLRGSGMAVRRICRCHPFAKGGLDPVKPKDGVPAATYLRATHPHIADELSRPPPVFLAALGPHH